MVKGGVITQEELGIDELGNSDFWVLGGALRTSGKGVLVFSYTHDNHNPDLEKVRGEFLNKRARTNSQIGEDGEGTPSGYLPAEIDKIRTALDREEGKLDSLDFPAQSPQRSLAHINVNTVYDHDYPGLGRIERKLATVFVPATDIDEQRAVDALSETITSISWKNQDAVPLTRELAHAYETMTNEVDPYERGFGYALEKVTPSADAMFVGQDGEICTVEHNQPFYRHTAPVVLVGRKFEVKKLAPKLNASYGKQSGEELSERDAAYAAITALKELFGKDFDYKALGMAFVRPDGVERVERVQKYASAPKANASP